MQLAQRQHPTVSNPWGPLGSFLFALTWLIPLVEGPWAAFLREGSISGLSLLLGGMVAFKIRGPMQLSRLALCALALALTPCIQFAFGLITVRGGAWITSAYLAGFALSIGCGALWDRADAGTMLDALFQAIGLAALATVGIQVYQWFHPSEVGGMWVAYTLQTRLAGNFGQSNHTATFLLWGVCALAWLWLRGLLKAWLAVLCATIFLTGVAVTVSKTASLGLLLICGLGWYWRALWPDKRVPWVLGALGVYFLAVSFFQPNDGAVDILVSNASGVARLQIWQMGLKAFIQQPWFGYGWGQIFGAQLAVASNGPQLHLPIISAHNLVLDVLLSCGICFGGLALGVSAVWLWRCFRAVNRPQEALLILFLLIVLNHAMLEFPLQYAYMLLPLGLVLGALDTRLSPWKGVALQMPKFVWLGALALASVLWGLILKDYFAYQDAYQDLVLHRVGMVTEPWQPPKAMLLNQLGARLVLEELDFKRKGRSLEELQAMEAVAALTPSGGAQLLLAASFAMNGHPDRAQWWLANFCSVYSEKACNTARAKWKQAAEKYPEISAITWPQEPIRPAKE
jgi:O-antigen ligase